MSSDQRTVIRSSWKVHFSAFAAGWRNSYLTVEDLRSNRTRRLPAPRAVFGIDEAQVEQARALIERWRQAHGGPDPVTPPVVGLGLA
jgi:hypothetical protein